MSLTLLGSLIEDALNDFVGNTIGAILWALCDIFFVIINLCENLFRRFAGLEILSMNGDKVEGDIVLYLLQTDIVQDVFFSIVILSFFLLIIFTTFAIVKNQYTEKPKPVMNIINNSVKGLLQYLMVPVCVVVGLAVGNVILQAVDGATRTQTGGSASDMLFVSAAYNANKVRSGDLDKRRDDLEHMLYWGYLRNIEPEIADIIGGSANNDLYKRADFATENQLDEVASLIDNSFVTGKLLYGGADKWLATAVFTYYDVLNMSYITIWVGGAFLVYCLIMIVWGLLGRIFKMVISYCITPALIAMYPMDEGKALKSWIGYFSKEATMAYVSIGIVNIFYSLLPVVKSIDLWAGGQWNVFNNIVQLLITISGYMLVKSFIGTVAGWFGTGDAMAAGASTLGDIRKGATNVTGKVAGATTKTIGTFAGIKGGWKQAGDVGKNKFFGALTGAYKGAGLDAKFDPTKAGKAWKDGQKSGADYYKQVKTSHMNDKLNKANQARFDAVDAIDKQKKSINTKIEDIEQAFILEMAGVDQNSNQYKTRRDEVDKEISSLKASAGFLDPLFERQQRVLDNREKKNTERKGNFALFDNMENAYKSLADYRKKFDAALSQYGITVDDDEWAHIQQGDFSDFQNPTMQNALQGVYSTFADGMLETQRSLEVAKRGISDLYKSSASGEKYVRDVLHGKVSLNAAGEVEIADKNSLQIRLILNDIKNERKDMNAQIKDLSEQQKQLKKDREEAYDRKDYGQKELEKISKGLK